MTFIVFTNADEKDKKFEEDEPWKTATAIMGQYDQFLDFKELHFVNALKSSSAEMKELRRSTISSAEDILEVELFQQAKQPMLMVSMQLFFLLWHVFHLHLATPCLSSFGTCHRQVTCICVVVVFLTDGEVSCRSCLAADSIASSQEANGQEYQRCFME